jgi:hyperosmotically inducible periplasmic protein
MEVIKETKDLNLTKRIQDRIKWDKRVSNTDVHVMSRAGKVTLIGNVDSSMKKIAALELARSTKGVTSVENKIEVSGNFQRHDNEITNLIRLKIGKMALVGKEFISLQVENGIVKLEGIVSSKQKKAQAASFVWELSGTVDCQNNISLLTENRETSAVERKSLRAPLIFELNPLDCLKRSQLAL